MLEPAVADRLAAGKDRIVVTGAGGWLGMAVLDLLAGALGDGFAKRVRAFGSSTRALRLRDGTQILQRPLEELEWLPSEPTLVLHLAFLTKDRAETMSEAEYRAANQAISCKVLGQLDRLGARAVFLASSGAAVKADDADASPAMRLYGAMKRDDEGAFADWAEAHGKRAVIGRIFNITGPYMNKPHAYAFASFMGDALAGRPIAVRAPREVVRSYVAIRELASLIFALLLAGDAGVERFDSGGDVLELGAVAQALAHQVPGATVARAPIAQGPADLYHGDGGAYAALLERHGITPVGLDIQITEGLADFRRHL